jgi:hypothetical protein
MQQPVAIHALHRRLMDEHIAKTGCDEREAFTATLAQAAKNHEVTTHGSGTVAAAPDLWAKHELPLNKGKK